MINHILANRLKFQMERIGISPRELSDKASVGKSFVYDILSGKTRNPTAKKLMAIAEVLGVHLSYLLRNEDNFCEAEDSITSISPIYYLEFINGELLSNRAVFYLPVHSKFTMNIKNLRVYNMQGDSMAPTLLNQDFLLINIIDKTPHPVGLFAIVDEIGISIKRIKYVTDNEKNIKLHIISDNKNYSSYSCDVNDIEILGRVTGYAYNLCSRIL